MFDKVMPGKQKVLSRSDKDRSDLIEEILAKRKIIRERNKREELARQDASVMFEDEYGPLLEPIRATKKGVSEIAVDTAQLPGTVRDIRDTQRNVIQALESLPQDLAAELPGLEGQPPTFAEAQSTSLVTRSQRFNDRGRSRIVEIGPVDAAAQMPENWRDLLMEPSSTRPTEARKEWPKWIWREYTGARQARGKKWEDFEEQVLEQQSQSSYETTGEGLSTMKTAKAKHPSVSKRKKEARPATETRYYKDPSELMSRLKMLASSVDAGNTSLEIINEANGILDHLFKDGEIDHNTYEGLLIIFNNE